MFRIHRYFAIATALVMLIAMVVLGVGYQRNALNTLVDVAENSNVALAHTLSGIILTHHIHEMGEQPGHPMDSRVLLSEMERVTDFLRPGDVESGILKIKVYNLQGITVYSSDPAEMGQDRQTQPHDFAFLGAAQAFKASSELSFKNRITAFSGELFNRDVVETYVPITDLAGVPIGVFEIYADVTEIKDRIDRLIPAVLLGLFGVFVLLYGALVLVVMRRAMAPMRLASQRAAQIGPGSSGERLPTEGMATEMLPLIDAINGALGRLDEALETQRQFTADAAHELLTPLAVLKANLATLGDDKAASLGPDVDVMSDIVTQLLELAEMDSPQSVPNEDVDLHEACISVAAMMAPAAHKQKVQIEFDDQGGGITAHCLERGLVRALRNLVENAVAVSPAGGTVTIRLQPDGAIRVSDQGPGVPPEKRELIFQRFWRGTRNDRPGVGLGLSIVKRFVDSCGGEVTVGEASGGGAEFTLRLPPAAAPRSGR